MGSRIFASYRALTLNVTDAEVVMFDPVPLQTDQCPTPAAGKSVIYSSPADGDPHPVTLEVSAVAVKSSVIAVVNPVMVMFVCAVQVLALIVVLLATVTVVFATG